MTSIEYSKIYSRFYSRVKAYDLVELPDDEITELLYEWLHSSISNPYVRRLFKTLSLDDEIQTLTYEMKTQTEEEADKEFVTEILSIGLVIQWLEPKINNIVNIAQVFSSSSAKFYSQANHLEELRAMYDSLKILQRRLIADRGYIWNSYTNNEG